MHEAQLNWITLFYKSTNSFAQATFILVRIRSNPFTTLRPHASSTHLQLCYLRSGKARTSKNMLVNEDETY